MVSVLLAVIYVIIAVMCKDCGMNKMNIMTVEEKVAYTKGYMEAMRWRDPEKELPEKDEMVLIKVQIRYTDTIVKVFPSIGILSECGLTHKMRLVDTHRSNGLIIGWRPIE